MSAVLIQKIGFERQQCGFEGEGMFRGSTKVALPLAFAAFLMATSSLHAQASQSPAVVCSAFQSSPVDDLPSQLNVICGQYAVSLGTVDSYELVQFPAIEAAVAVTTLDGVQRAFLLIRNEDGGVALEEITTAIAQQAGRGVQPSISGIRLAFDNAVTGVMTATVNSAGANSNAPVSIDIAAMVERSRAVHAQSKPLADQ